MVFTKVFKLVNSSGALKVATSKYRPICCVNARETATSTIKVTINVPFHTKFGESVAVAGLNGSWEPEAALTLNWTQGDIWTGEVDLPTGSALECKYIVRHSSPAGTANGSPAVHWQAGDNLVLLIPPEAHAAEVTLNHHEVSVSVKSSTTPDSLAEGIHLSDTATDASNEAIGELLNVQSDTVDVPTLATSVSPALEVGVEPGQEVPDLIMSRNAEVTKEVMDSVIEQALDEVDKAEKNNVAEELEAYVSGSSSTIVTDARVFEAPPATSKKTRAAKKA